MKINLFPALSPRAPPSDSVKNPLMREAESGGADARCYFGVGELSLKLKQYENLDQMSQACSYFEKLETIFEFWNF